MGKRSEIHKLSKCTVVVISSCQILIHHLIGYGLKKAKFMHIWLLKVMTMMLKGYSEIP